MELSIQRGSPAPITDSAAVDPADKDQADLHDHQRSVSLLRQRFEAIEPDRERSGSAGELSSQPDACSSPLKAKSNKADGLPSPVKASDLRKQFEKMSKQYPNSRKPLTDSVDRWNTKIGSIRVGSLRHRFENFSDRSMPADLFKDPTEESADESIEKGEVLLTEQSYDTIPGSTTSVVQEVQSDKPAEDRDYPSNIATEGVGHDTEENEIAYAEEGISINANTDSPGIPEDQIEDVVDDVEHDVIVANVVETGTDDVTQIFEQDIYLAEVIPNDTLALDDTCRENSMLSLTTCDPSSRRDLTPAPPGAEAEPTSPSTEPYVCRRLSIDTEIAHGHLLTNQVAEVTDAIADLADDQISRGELEREEPQSIEVEREEPQHDSLDHEEPQLNELDRGELQVVSEPIIQADAFEKVDEAKTPIERRAPEARTVKRRGFFKRFFLCGGQAT